MARLEFRAKIIEWRGPAPHFFAPLSQESAERIRRVAKVVSYGWGVIPVEATIGGTNFTTSLFPKEDTYLLPIKAAVRKTLGITVDDGVDVMLTLGRPGDRVD